MTVVMPLLRYADEENKWGLDTRPDRRWGGV